MASKLCDLGNRYNLLNLVKSFVVVPAQNFPGDEIGNLHKALSKSPDIRSSKSGQIINNNTVASPMKLE